MATINKSGVIQKLIDELSLEPGLEQVPTQVAKEIVPTFQINDQAVTVSAPVAKIIKSSIADGTIYTVPATGKFFLTNTSLHGNTGNPGVNIDDECTITVTPKGGVAVIISGFSIRHTATIAQGFYVNSDVQSFSSPIELEPGSIIDVNSPAEINTRAVIIGYTKDD